MTEIMEYFKSSPGITLLFCALLLAIILMQCLTRKIFFKVRFIAAAIITTGAALILVFFNQMKTSERAFWGYFADYSLLGIDVLLVVLLFTSIDFSFTSEVLNKELTKSIDSSRNYVLLDKKDRVKEISTCLANELGIDKSDAYGKNFFDVIEINNRIVGVNGEEVFSDEIKSFYAHYKRDKNRIVNPFEITITVNDTAKKSVMFFTETNIFSNDRYKGRILYGNKKNEEALVGLEKDIEVASTKLDNLKNRLSFLVTNTVEGLYFYNVTKKEMWFNDVLVKKLALNSNTLTIQEFLARLHPADVEIYTEIINKPITDYKISYRFNTGAYYLNLSESGRKTVSSFVEICGIVTVINDFGYAKTNTILDKVQTEEYMRLKYNDLLKADNQLFQVAYFKLNEIPSINEKYGRAVGNEILANYLYRFIHNYLPEGYIYRVGGLEFVGFLTNVNRMAALREHLLENEDKVLTISFEVANEKIKTSIYLGLAFSKDDEYHKEKTLDHAKDALSVALNERYNSKYVNYKDIK